MQDTNYVPRNFATLKKLGIFLPFNVILFFKIKIDKFIHGNKQIYLHLLIRSQKKSFGRQPNRIQ